MQTVNVGDRVTVARPGNRYRGRFGGKTGTVTRVSTNPTTVRVQVLTTIDKVCWFPIEELDAAPADPASAAARLGEIDGLLEHWEAVPGATCWTVRTLVQGAPFVDGLTSGQAQRIVERHNAEVTAALARLDEYAGCSS